MTDTGDPEPMHGDPGDDPQGAIDDYLSGLLDETGIRELEERLCSDGDLRRLFVRYARLDTDLQLELRARLAGARALGHLGESDPRRTGSDDRDPARPVGAGAPRSTRGRLVRALGLGSVLVAGWVLWRFSPPEPVSFPRPVVSPRELRLTFDGPIEGGLRDRTGRGTGFTHRLPGTGELISGDDPNLRVDPQRGQLELTITRSDINYQQRLEEGEYLGVRLADLGFTGEEDFVVTATVPESPELAGYGQFGLYAGTRSDRNIRGGVIKWGDKHPGHNTQFLVNNDGGQDTDIHKIGLVSPGMDLRLTLERSGGKYSLAVENLTRGGTSTLQIRHPGFLDGEPDLYVGLFVANPHDDERRTVIIRDFSVLVWTGAKAEEVFQRND